MTKKLFLYSCLALFIYMFLITYYLESFGNSSFIHSLSYSFIIIGSFIGLSSILFRGVRSVELDGQNFPKFIQLLSSNFVLSTVIIFLYNSIFNGNYNFEMFSSTFVELSIISIAPILFSLFFYEKKLIKVKYELINIKSNSTEDDDKGQELKLVSDSQKTSLDINIDNFLFVEGADNYCKIYYYEDGKLKMELFRSTLKNISNQLESLDGVFRCHRSYIINAKKISKVSGNSQAYKIEFDNVSTKIPVSRSFDISVLKDK